VVTLEDRPADGRHVLLKEADARLVTLERHVRARVYPAEA
jgi:hypothetical protein